MEIQSAKLLDTLQLLLARPLLDASVRSYSSSTHRTCVDSVADFSSPVSATILNNVCNAFLQNFERNVYLAAAIERASFLLLVKLENCVGSVSLYRSGRDTFQISATTQLLAAVESGKAQS